MLLISKESVNSAAFSHEISANKIKRWEDLASFKSPHFELYKKVRDQISKIEQRGLSAYTEVPLGKSIHIDHFRKRNMFPLLIFDYTNLFVDDLNDNYGACFKDNHSGITIQDYTGSKRIFCPLEEDMSQYVDYNYDGMMIAKKGLSSDDEIRVKKTIRIFNLNFEALKNRRRDLIKLVNEYRGYGLDDRSIRDSFNSFGFPTLVDWVLREL